MRPLRSLLLSGLAAVLLFSMASAQQHPRDAAIADADTRAWWHTTEDLANDGMEGRDTGSAAYQRAADSVAARFRQAGLQPAGDNGTFFQTVPMHEVDLLPEGTSFTVTRSDGTRLPLQFLQEITATPSAAMPRTIRGALTFRGYCGNGSMQDIAGEVVLCFGTQRTGLPGGAERLRNAREGGAAAIVSVDDPYFTIEPPRWPYAYARTVTFAGARPASPQRTTKAGATTGRPAGSGESRPAQAPGLPGEPAQVAELVSLRLSAAAFARLLTGTGNDAAAILKRGGAREPLGSFDLPAHFDATLDTAARDIASPNVLAVLPGSDPDLRQQYVVVAAHLDGYGFGTAVAGDTLYNGALDDAAYVALLIQMADNLSRGRHGVAQPGGSVAGPASSDGVSLAPPKRSILFCAFTGEEKGLLGSTWFVQHPTVPLSQMAADINLDQLRPLFPLKILTALAIHDTSLGATAAEVGKRDGIVLREDREPERGLLRRADHYPFLKAGVPAIGFIFGFDPGTDEERRYRQWYQVQYHRPQDDLSQPIDFSAAMQFNRFFYGFVEEVANTPERPRLLTPVPVP